MDSVDSVGGIQNIVFDEENQERKPWLLCGKNIPRSEIVFFAQLFFLLVFIAFLIFKLCVTEKPEEITLWVALLTSSIGYILPNPRP